ncbi:Origin recognition complex subunit 6 [Komagataella phaffii CBS 7435]|uniref:ORC6 first cyclin-like domain-containing protein n=2 Tax=Komagataella phaffii TaxID=460519 RepID=C4R5Z9_KOMPG|nr:uncharacterized protein PAS_chr3_1239 [Komagataella phaffii GS115]AOA63951.1 GQ67_04052T0 [Komagataella phaffii]CAH2449197.1 Origin recognition complex subunit 6 [Komagataella phaffii CBS 7435]AOA69326.1 GQ68_04025T0 [Komagataella phaffii GS115]CAY70985.1 hypothetical protein PAS_chr3_1239 [Komagataella phaffii GS115]CCA39216.1 Origin recognition complex subunit 6 [Komagataella phaffii CBS 7435]
MNKELITNSIRDLIPIQPEPFPGPLIAKVDDFITGSRLKAGLLKQNQEFARTHICALLAIESLGEKFSLPEPLVEKIPLPKTGLKKVLNHFRRELKVTRVPISDQNPFQKGRQNPTMAPEKRTKSKEAEVLEDIGLPSPMSTPGKSNTLTEKKKRRSPIKGKSSTPSTPSSSPRKQMTVTIPQFTAFCAKFYIPSETIRPMLGTFFKFSEKIKNPWCLLCGLVAFAYIKLNNREIKAKLGAKTNLYNKLHALQNGGMLKKDIHYWCNLIEKLIIQERWVQDLIYSVNEGPFGEERYGFGDMLTHNVRYATSNSLKDNHEQWLKDVNCFLVEQI